MMRMMLLSAMLGSAMAPAAVPAVNDPSDLAEIRRIEELVQPVVRMDDVIDHYADDAVTVDLWAPGVYRGRQAIRDSFAVWLAPVAAMKLRIDEMNIASDGDMACALMQLHFDTTMKDGTKLSMSTRTLDALRRIDGRWQIVQQHVALPLSPADGLAVMNDAVPAGAGAFADAPLRVGAAVSVAQARRELAAWNVADRGVETDRLVPQYGDQGILYDLDFPGVARGASAIAARTAAANRAVVPGTSRSAETITNGRFAVQLRTATLRPRGAATPQVLRSSDCLVRDGGRWRSLFALRSYLVDVATRRPVPAPAGALDRVAPVARWTGTEASNVSPAQ